MRAGPKRKFVDVPKESAEGGEVEVHGDRVTFGRKDMDGGGVGDEGIGGEIEFERCTCQGARTVATAPRVRPAVRVGGEDLLVIKDLDLEVSPEITGPRDESRRCIGARACGRSKKCAIRRGKLDFDEDFDQLFLPEMIEAGLLSAVAADAVLGELSELREWGEKSNGRNVGAGLGRREKLDVFAQVGCIMALAEEIGFADGLVGQGTVESESGRNKQQCRSENREAGPDGRGHYANL